MSQKPHRMYVRVKDGKPREPNKLKGLLLPHVDVIDAKDKVEFFIYAVKEAHLEQVRAKLAAAGLEAKGPAERGISRRWSRGGSRWMATRCSPEARPELVNRTKPVPPGAS